MLYTVPNPLQVYTNPSSIARRQACETKACLHSLLGVDKRRGPSTDDRDRGKALHAFADCYVRRYAEVGQLWAFDGPDGEQVAREIFEDLADDEGCDFDEYAARSILDAARAQLPRLGLEDFEVVHMQGEPLIELDLKDIIDGVPYQAIVDAVLRHKQTGKVWIVDWKTTLDPINSGDPKQPNYVRLDMQLALQRLLVESHGVKVDYCALVQIRSFAPEQPAQTSRKKLTRDLKKLSCDGATYREALIANGEEIGPKELEKIEALDSMLFVRWVPDITSEAGQAAMRAEIFKEGRRMQELARGDAEPSMNLRNMTGHLKYLSGCTRCDYQSWCRELVESGGEEQPLHLVGVQYVANDKATFEIPEASTPRSAAEDYVDFARSYGVSAPHEFKSFKP